MRLLSFLSRVGLTVLLAFPPLAFAQELKPIQLPKPQMDGGRPLMQVLQDRRSTREFSLKSLSHQTMSNMLWAAFGINRPDSGKRTAPSARNWQETDIYVTTTEGVYLYDAVEHVLRPVLSEDIRALTGQQPYVGEAPVNLVYVADYSKMDEKTDRERLFLSGADTGFISQNVYLYCVSEGLGTVVRGLIDRPALAEVIGLRSEQKITLAQSVGYPKE